jgi:hypothetical protein
LRKEWKEVQVNPRDNPLGVNVYKLAAKDKKGAWFARRSVHEGLSFERWKYGMEIEFAESLKIQGKPGDGKIRGIGADKRVEDIVVDGCGKMEGTFRESSSPYFAADLHTLVYQLSAQFPGPTTPRDFVTLLASSDSAMKPPMQEGLGKTRYFMLVSKPCIHPDCPQRSGYIRGQYESVEFIREIKIEKPLRKVRSSVDLGNEDSAAARQNAMEDLNKEALLRSARKAALSSSASDLGDTGGRKRGKTISFAGTGEDGLEDDDDDCETVVEWLMVTRSDPGGSVPRFMVEKGTPAGIAGDANKFMKWVSTKHPGDSTATDDADSEVEMDQPTPRAEEFQQEKPRNGSTPTYNLTVDPSARTIPGPVTVDDQDQGSGGIYGMIAGALNAAASRLPNPFGSAKGGDSDLDISPAGSTEDDSSSVLSFHSVASMPEESGLLPKSASEDHLTVTTTTTNTEAEAQSTHSSESAAALSTAAQSTAPSQHEKDLRKLEERRRKLQEKMEKAQERAVSKKQQDSERDESAIAKLREKHEREVAKQEEKYRRELKRLEDKRAQEQKKSEEKKKKALEQEMKANLSMELDKTKAERDLALKQIEILKEQVGDLQQQNTMLVAKLGKQSSPELLADLKRVDSFKKAVEA